MEAQIIIFNKVMINISNIKYIYLFILISNIEINYFGVLC